MGLKRQQCKGGGEGERGQKLPILRPHSLWTAPYSVGRHWKQWFFADNYRPSQQTTVMSEVKFSKQTHIKKSIWRTKILWKCSFSAKTGKFLKLDTSPCPWWNSPNNFCSKLFFVRINHLSNVLVKLSCLGKPKSKICFKLQCRQK